MEIENCIGRVEGSDEVSEGQWFWPQYGVSLVVDVSRNFCNLPETLRNFCVAQLSATFVHTTPLPRRLAAQDLARG